MGQHTRRLGHIHTLRLHIWLFTLVLTGSCLVPGLSLAHKLKVFAWVSGDTVTVESSFSGGRTLVKGMVDVQDAGTGATLVQGQTDEQGVFSFSLQGTVKPPATTLRIVVSGGEGHQNEWILKPEAYQIQAATNTPDTATAAQPEQLTVREKETTSLLAASSPAGQPATFSRDELTTILDEQLEAKLAPLRRSLAQAQERGPRLTDILGGIGYIIGIAGIIAWMKSKK